MRIKGSIAYAILFFVIVLAVWLAFFAMPQPQIVKLEQMHGAVDLSAADLEDTLYYYTTYWGSYPGKLYTPDDFESSDATGAPQYLETPEYERNQFITHTLQITLPHGRVYALSLKSSDYAMRIYINGELVDAVGNPAETKEANIPRVQNRTYAFYPQTDTTTIIVQAANWVHKEGAYSPNLYIGSYEAIGVYERYNQILTALITGGLLTAFLYHLGLFMLNRRRRVVLLFALCCFLLTLLMNKLPQLFFPDYNWYVVFRMEYIVHFLTFAMLTQLLSMLYPTLYRLAILRAYQILAGVFMLLTCILSTRLISTLLGLFDGVSVLTVIYTLVRLAMQLRSRRLQDITAFLGIFLVCLFGVNDILYQNDVIFLGSIAGQQFTTPIAMLFFVFCYGLVIAIDYAETEQRMLAAQKLIAEAEEKYHALLEDQKKNSASASRAQPADFNLSQRETDVLWLLLSGKTRKDIAALLFISMGTVNTYCTRIYHKTGCTNLGELFHLLGGSANTSKNS